MKHYLTLSKNDLLDYGISLVKNSKKIQYTNIESALDIETTSTKIKGEKFAFSYIWMLGIGVDKDIYYGRTWEELIEFTNFISETLELTTEKRLVIYVHNLGYEFQFMRKYFLWDSVFSVDERKPVKALTTNGIEFRDSYILSGYSLANTAKNLTKFKIRKMEGDLDYSLIRHHKTELTESEMKYCEEDVRIILCYINEQIELAGDINKIPMTNTGRVRNYVRDNCYYDNANHRKSSKGKYRRYRAIMEDLTVTPDDYKQLKRAFMGGFTHSNPEKTGMVLEDVASFDLTSSYPSAMLADKYPMSRGKRVVVNTEEELTDLFKKNCVVFDIKLTGVTNKIKYESYLSESKCRNVKGAVVNNGRIYEADELVITITDVDYDIIKAVYEWESMTVKNVIIFTKAYLPKSIIESILDLYEKKTTLKGVEGKEVEYLLSKGMLNSVYGMSVTDIVKDESIYGVEDEWKTEKVNLNEKIEDYNKSKNRFLFYAWGIYVTAYSRRNLWSAIISVKDDYVYSDTDSVKLINYSNHIAYIDKYNAGVTRKLEKMCEVYSIDPKRLSPETIEGVEKPLGVWEFEGVYNKFKTLGAKRYLYLQGGEYTLTVAGLGKKTGMEYIKEVCENDSDKIFTFFNDDLYIPADKTGKMTHTYLDEGRAYPITDFNGVTEYVESLSSIHLENCEFTLSLSEKYLEFLGNIKNGFIFKGNKHI